MRDGNHQAKDIYCQVKIMGSGHRRLERREGRISFYLIRMAIGIPRSSEDQKTPGV